MDTLKDFELKDSELVKYFREQLSGIRGGRPTTKLVESITVDYLGQKLRILELGSISIILPREIRISVWDNGVVQNIAKAVEETLSVKVNVEGNLIRINLPALSTERRQELEKLVKKEAEEVRIRMRSLRDEFLKRVKQQEEKGDITEDDRFRLKGEIQKNIDKTNDEIEKILENKIKEIND